MEKMEAFNIANAELIANMTQRCIQEGMNSADVPDVSGRDDVLPERRWLVEHAKFDVILDELHEYVYSIGGVVFYANDKGIICQPLSCFKALDLETPCIKPGIDIHGQTLGTCAPAVIADLPEDGKEGSEAWVVGDDHYLDALKPYATYCGFDRDYEGGLYTIIIIPKEEFSERFVRFMHTYQMLKKERLNSHRLEVLRAAFAMFEINSQPFEANQGYLLTGIYGRVLWCDDHFAKIFDIDAKAIQGTDVRNLFPELKDTLDKFRDNYGHITAEETTSLHAPLFSRQVNSNFVVCVGADIAGGFEKGIGVGLRFKVVGQRNTKRQKKQTGAIYTFKDIIGESKAIKDAIVEGVDAAKSMSSVLILGESGTGKELLAQSIHNASGRSAGPFVAINCANTQHNLIESELFGYAEGSFTGANKGGAKGRIEFANKGTLFLDEVAEMPLSTQALLLRALETREVYPIGSNKPVATDFRLICATNKNLEEMVDRGEFRLDLYYRINVLTVNLPPLRAREGDVQLLCDYYVYYFNNTIGTDIEGVDEDARAALQAYSFPGNLREIRNIIERAVQRADKIIYLADLPKNVLKAVEMTVG